jgi:hypothetical protein
VFVARVNQQELAQAGTRRRAPVDHSVRYAGVSTFGPHLLHLLVVAAGVVAAVLQVRRAPAVTAGAAAGVVERRPVLQGLPARAVAQPPVPEQLLEALVAPLVPQLLRARLVTAVVAVAEAGTAAGHVRFLSRQSESGRHSDHPPSCSTPDQAQDVRRSRGWSHRA